MRASLPTGTPRGFTLVELMVVVAIIGTVGAMGTILIRRALASNKAPAFARSFISIVHEARHAALATGRSARLRFSPAFGGAPGVVYSEVVDPSDSSYSNWLPLGSISAPILVEFCQPAASVVTTTTSPTCPMTTTMNTIVCFAPNGRVNLTTTSTACPGTGSSTASTPSTGTGATLYLKGLQAGGNDVRYKVMIWGLTGLPKMTDQW